MNTLVAEKVETLRNAWQLDKKRAVDMCVNRINRWLAPKAIDDYFIPPPGSDRYVLITHAADHYYDGFQLPRFYSTPRQTVWEGREIARICHQLGWGVDIYDAQGNAEPDDFEKYDALIGFEPNFEGFAKRLDNNVLKIYLGLGMHWSQRNPALKAHVERLNERRGTDREPKRLRPETRSEELADVLLIIGDEYTCSTYLDHLGEKPYYNIYSSTYDFLSCGVDERDYETARRNLLWFTSGDLVSKGLDVTLEAVAGMEGVDLYICGPLEADDDFVAMYETELFETDNIHPVGWVDVGSEEFEDLTRRCGYTIHTGVTEGFPGGLAHCLRRGVVPIVTREVASGVDGWGIQVPDHEIETIRSTVEDAVTLDPEELRAMAERACERAEAKHSRDAYSARLREVFETVLAEQARSSGTDESRPKVSMQW